MLAAATAAAAGAVADGTAEVEALGPGRAVPPRAGGGGPDSAAAVAEAGAPAPVLLQRS